jgi:hypothetical protein
MKDKDTKNTKVLRDSDCRPGKYMYFFVRCDKNTPMLNELRFILSKYKHTEGSDLQFTVMQEVDTDETEDILHMREEFEHVFKI